MHPHPSVRCSSVCRGKSTDVEGDSQAFCNGKCYLLICNSPWASFFHPPSSIRSPPRQGPCLQMD